MKEMKPFDDLRLIRNQLLNDQNIITTTNMKLKVEKEIDEILFIIPNIIALYLSIAKKNKEEFKIKWEKLDTTKVYSIENKILDANNTILLYDIFENIITSIVFSCFSIEAFVNQLIPSEYKDPYGNNKIYIEKNINLEIKLKYLIPNIYEIEGPQNEIFWPNIRKLIRLRNELVHLKSDETIFPQKQIKLLFESLITFFKIDYNKSVKELMKYFAERLNDNEKFKFHYMMPREIDVYDWVWEMKKVEKENE